MSWYLIVRVKCKLQLLLHLSALWSESYDGHVVRRSEFRDAPAVRQSESYDGPAVRQSESHDAPAVRHSEPYNGHAAVEVKQEPMDSADDEIILLQPTLGAAPRYPKRSLRSKLVWPEGFIVRT